MTTLYFVLGILLLLLSILPKVPHSHWIFRTPDFGKIQVSILLVITLLIGFLFADKSTTFYLLQGILLGTLILHLITLIKYTPLYPIKKHQPSGKHSKSIHLVSANIFQFNSDYNRFVNFIKKHQPDIFITMESNGDWEKSLRVLENDYPFQHKVTLENTYGMHLYSKLEIDKATTHFFVADDIPSIEAHFTSKDGYPFVVFGVHPPPPSPTEEKTSKERDGDLLSIANRILELNKKPIVVIGDFNNVAWSKSSILFRKVSHLIDPRIGHGFVSTFHAKYWFLRFPIDLMFHSENVFIQELKTLENFGSDHLPVYCKFYIDQHNNDQKEEIEHATAEEKKEAQEMIQEGIEEDGERDTVVTE